MHKFTSYLLVLGCLVACDPMWRPPPQTPSSDVETIMVCSALPTKHAEHVEYAVTQWDNALKGWRRMWLVESTPQPWCDITIVEVPFAGPEDGKAAGITACIGCPEIVMIKGRYEQDVAMVTLHEIGHALGADHVPGTMMVSKWSADTIRCPDATTVAQVAAFQHVDLDFFSWCSE